MLSFRQYIQEIVTDKPKTEPEYEYASNTTPAEEGEHGYTDHAYRYDHPSKKHGPGTTVQIRTTHRDDGDSSDISFNVGGTVSRTGKSSTEDAMKRLNHVVHGASHHIRKVKPKFFSYEVKDNESSRHPSDPSYKPHSRNKKARKNIYHKIMDRLAHKHGYELHNIRTDAPFSHSSPHGIESRFVRQHDYHTITYKKKRK